MTTLTQLEYTRVDACPRRPMSHPVCTLIKNYLLYITSSLSTSRCGHLLTTLTTRKPGHFPITPLRHDRHLRDRRQITAYTLPQRLQLHLPELRRARPPHFRGVPYHSPWGAPFRTTDKAGRRLYRFRAVSPRWRLRCRFDSPSSVARTHRRPGRTRDGGQATAVLPATRDDQSSLWGYQNEGRAGGVSNLG
ncbi:hypothetical protein SERLA73DRAFT_181533 [Serpula lacrymans var. lacrymans S7.3]|uniref:Uncharacterized protein n=2 Tax=Serpula lacrymans var. lacrymans TaxID=341189 RepID=F8PY84_SERL3|nr:uncharacterized protein SERLADRAFT_467733 [Serpula lacrymans var. lacrymans S7.9]EGN98847.1 hypothetical protein SERLA73DRAFT_181533 [Serpula lacrymans var. lacrymans S7.3]EGO24435.1 hypothetical protein SERLADRAFT_467733 [Serpula lacrymans var. lacrymans S7.9]